MKKKNLFLTGIIYLLLFGMYNLLIFVIFKSRSDVFWISYSFMCLAFALQIVALVASIRNTNIETVFFGIPLLSLSVYYILAELFVSLVMMIFQSIGSVAAITVQTLLAGAFLVVAILALMARDTVQEIDKQVKEKVSFLKSIRVEVEMLHENCQDPETKTKLYRLCETVRYSDPMTNDTVANLDQRIMQKLSELRIAAAGGNAEVTRNACSEMEALFVERNKKLLISK